MLDINEIIKKAKLGRERKDAQVDTCTVFAAALYDVLTAQGIRCQMVCAVNKDGLRGWAHLLVKVEGHCYDSLGEFTTAIYRARAKHHPSVTESIEYRNDSRIDCYEPEFDCLYIFFVKALKKSLLEQKVSTVD